MIFISRLFPVPVIVLMIRNLLSFWAVKFKVTNSHWISMALLYMVQKKFIVEK